MVGGADAMTASSSSFASVCAQCSPYVDQAIHRLVGKASPRFRVRIPVPSPDSLLVAARRNYRPVRAAGTRGFRTLLKERGSRGRILYSDLVGVADGALAAIPDGGVV